MTKFNEQLLTPPSGFPDLTPREAIATQRVLDVIRKHYEMAGFLPIETSLVERTEVLTAKSEGEIGTQIYGLRLLNPAEGAPTDEKSLALRFDQTVPLARFVAANYGRLSFPFRRYVMGPVFRGERPKAGRFRQFTQADIDTLGNETLDVLHDAEVIATIAHIFAELNIGDFTLRINNRKILEGVLEVHEVKSTDIGGAIAVIDRAEKVPLQETIKDLNAFGENVKAESWIEKILSPRSTDDTLAFLKMISEKQNKENLTTGYNELSRVINGLRSLNVAEKNFTIDLSIARGLSYYTGTVFETRLEAHPEIGSIASGGRYENLVGTYVNKSIPGVGASIGVTRLVNKLIEAGVIETNTTSIAPVVVLSPSGEARGADYLALAQEVRTTGIACETYLVSRALGKQLEYANKRGFRFAIIAGENEFDNQSVIVKDLKTGEQSSIPRSDIAVYFATH
jgi:histidyl-tRNA synthetase